MTVANQACRALLNWTGAETTLAPGFGALSRDHVSVTYTPASGIALTLVDGQHIAISIDPATRAIDIAPLAMPPAPGVVKIERLTPSRQDVVFVDGQPFSADVHEDLHDAHVYRAQETLRALADVQAAFLGISLQQLAAYPITRNEGVQALKANASIAGNWFALVEAQTPGDEADEYNNLFMAPFWPAGGRQWKRVQSILAGALGAFTDAQRIALETQALAFRSDP